MPIRAIHAYLEPVASFAGYAARTAAYAQAFQRDTVVEQLQAGVATQLPAQANGALANGEGFHP
jgi:hypothetical protein